MFIPKWVLWVIGGGISAWILYNLAQVVLILYIGHLCVTGGGC